MKKFISTILVSICLLGCTDNDLKINLDPNQDLSFSGTFKTNDSDENIFENVNLKISNGYYECTTNLPFGYGAGKVEVNGNLVNFIDTAFFAVPALYGPSYVLSGKHYYIFNGEDLEIWRTKSVGSIEYKLKLLQ
jgi:hypothetical protein